MLPDTDGRHGTYAGHVAGCRKPCCTKAKLAYDKRRKYDKAQGKNRTVPAVGTVRRIQALQALGHSMEAIGAASGISHRTLHGTLHKNLAAVYVDTHEGMIRAYAALSMTLAQGRYGNRQRAIARRKGFVPPLAWDDVDLDNPDARPYCSTTPAGDLIDESVVERLLAGQRVESIPAEKTEAMRRWMSTGRSQKSLCDIHGWRPGRYKEAS